MAKILVSACTQNGFRCFYRSNNLFYFWLRIVLGFSFISFVNSKATGFEGVEWNRSSLWLKKGEFIEAIPPSSAKKVKLEFKNQESGEWEVQNTGHLPKYGTGKLYFKLPKDIARRNVRLKWSNTQTLPFSFFNGRSSFGLRGGNPIAFESQRIFATDSSLSQEISSTTDNGTEKVQESDLWRVLGSKLFFFNQFRGLQLVDLSIPQDPQVLSRYRLPASGEQMYVTEDGDYAFLITRKAQQGWPYESEIRILKVEKNLISEVTTIDLPGSYRESRLIDGKLYLLSEKWEEDKINEKGWAFSYSTRLTSLDLENPEKPLLLDVQVIPGSPQVISATNSNLIVVTRDPADYYNKHIVRIFDLTNFDGIPRETLRIAPGGRVLDKFKMHIRNETLTIISQAYRDNKWTGRYSLLENFNLRSGKRLGFLELAERETLYATRFDGDLAYVVTFLQTDPLFIIDLSNPESPEIISELIVPGWSEYIQPVQNKLFAVGVESNQVTASIFDVSDKKHPTLEHRLYMGEKGGYSWSEANYNEKAIGQLPGLGIFLIPYQSWEGNQYINKIQIIEVTDSGLLKRGTIDHRFQARRSIPDQTGTKIYSISGNELQITNFVNREDPTPLATFPLAWKVDQIYSHKNSLVQLEDNGGYNWGWSPDHSDANATLRVTLEMEPDNLISSINLGEGSLVGSFVNQDILHLALLDNKKLVVKAYSISEDGLVHKLGQSETLSNLNANDTKLTGFLLNNNTICWASHGKTYNHYPYFRSMDIIQDSYYPSISSDSSEVKINIFSFENSFTGAKITHESNATISVSGNVEWSMPFILDDQLIYGSKKTSYLHDSQEVSRIVKSDINASLHRLDLYDPTKPKVLPTLAAPGLLAGLYQLRQDSPEAFLFFESKDTTIDDFIPVPEIKSSATRNRKYGRVITACAFDGTNIFYLDELEISNNTAPLTFLNDLIFIAQDKQNGSGIQSYQLDESGLFSKKEKLFTRNEIIDVVTNESFLIGQGRSKMFFSKINNQNTSIYSFEGKLSGDFHPILEKFISTDQHILIPSGDYGIERFSLPQPESENVNSTSPKRRNTTIEEWKIVEDNNLKIFTPNEVPITFPSSNGSGWKYRPDSNIEQNATTLPAHWKNLSWLGSFYSRGYPWVYHQKLKWIYLHESQDSIWLWNNNVGWFWTTPTVFPYLFFQDLNSWAYVDPGYIDTSVRLYNFSSQTWEMKVF